MIKVKVLRDNNKAYGVDIKNHGDKIVCSAVSILLLNCVNSIEVFTDADFKFECAKMGGDAVFKIVEFDDKGKAELLLESLILGLKSIEESYNKDIKVFD
ncbi:MAG: ribosomal-processing cysteine protease Prp [Lachnospirales bacterium]